MGTNAQNYFTQLLQENQQINVFISGWTLEHAAEEQAEARHRVMMDVIYTEASMHIISLEAHADTERSRRLAFVRQGTHVLISQLNSEMTAYGAEAEEFQSRLLHSETDCHEERRATLRLTPQIMSLATRALHCEIALKHNELQTAQLRKSFDDNRSTLLEYLAQEFEFEEKLQWEEPSVMSGTAPGGVDCRAVSFGSSCVSALDLQRFLLVLYTSSLWHQNSTCMCTIIRLSLSCTARGA